MLSLESTLYSTVSLLPPLTLAQVWMNVQALLGEDDLANKRANLETWAGIMAEYGQT